MIVYLVTNTVTGGRYVGITVRPLEQRWREHVKRASDKSNTRLARAIHKYGPSSFKLEVLAELENHETLLAAEKAFIASLGTFSDRDYNMTPGGEIAPTLVHDIAMRGGATRSKNYRGPKHHRFGTKRSEETLAKLKATLAAKPIDLEKRRRRSEDMKIRWVDPAHRAKVSSALKGKPKPPRSAEHKAKLAEAKRGVMQTPEQRANTSAAMKKWWADRKRQRV